jgi:hypothetical protein
MLLPEAADQVLVQAIDKLLQQVAGVAMSSP